MIDQQFNCWSISFPKPLGSTLATMKKLIFVGLFLLTACLPPSNGQGASPEPSPLPTVTATRVTPTSVPATVTPTIPPSPTATPIPPKKFFTEEFDTTPVYWSTLYASGDPGRVDILNDGGALTFELYSSNAWLYAIYGAFEYDSVHIETLVESQGSDLNAMGLVCNYSEQDGWYEFNISSDSTYNVLYGQWMAEGIARYTPILNDTSDRIATGNTTNEIGLDCYENILQLYINGKLIRKLNVEHIGLTSGKVGLTLGSFEEAPVILAFDWVKVSEP
jgi:hypothetical protein